MNTRIIQTLVIVAAVAAAVTSARAQEPAEKDTLPYRTGEVVVSAGRSFSAASDASFRAADFALQPKGSAQDLLRLVPGLVIAQHAGGGKAEQIFLRGFDADHGTDVNIVVDDAPVNMVSHGHGQGYADLHFVIPETIERVDVVKGPYFARYGDFLTAGAVSMVTVDSIDANRIMLEGGMFDTYRVLGLLRAPFTGSDVSGYVAGEIFGSNGYVEAPQDFHRLNLFAKVRAGLPKRGSLEASLMSFASGWDASGQIPERAVKSGAIGRFGSIDPAEGGATSRTTALLRWESGGALPMVVTGSYTDYRFRLFSNFTFFANDSLRGDGIEQTDRRSVLALRAETSTAYELAGVPMLTRFGTGLRSDDIRVALYHDSARVRLETTVDAAIAQRQIGSYVEQEIELPWAQIQLGLRADYMSFDVENVLRTGVGPEGIVDQLLLSPKANVAVPIGDRAAIFLNSGFGFHSNDARAVVAAGKDARPPRAFGAEIGARWGAPRDLVSLSAAAWMLELEQELVYVGDEGTTEESGRTLRRGIDLEAQLRPASWLALGLDATFSHGRFVDVPDGENHIPLAPSVTFTGSAVARFDPFSAALRVRAVGDRPANEANSVRALGYTIVDLTARYDLDPVELTLQAENLFDVEWNEAQFDTASRLRGETATISELHFTPGTPLAVRGGIGVRF